MARLIRSTRPLVQGWFGLVGRRAMPFASQTRSNCIIRKATPPRFRVRAANRTPLSAGARQRVRRRNCGVNRNTAILFFPKPREVILDEPASLEPGLIGGEIAVGESCLGGGRKGERERGATGEVPIFGLLEAWRRGSCRRHPKCPHEHAFTNHTRQGPARLHRPHRQLRSL